MILIFLFYMKSKKIKVVHSVMLNTCSWTSLRFSTLHIFQKFKDIVCKKGSLHKNKYLLPLYNKLKPCKQINKDRVI